MNTPHTRHLLVAALLVMPAFTQAQTAPDLDGLTAAQAAADICAGKYISEALVAAAIARAKARAELNAFITLDETGALKAARAFDAARKRGGCKPLGGVPVVIKDNIEVAGLPASAGTPALKGFVPKADAPVAAKLRKAGAIILGKTNMHELAFGISGYNTAFKTGEQFGLGTDTGGSVRIPCALNGCASLRPTMGRYAQKGIAPISHTRDTAGPMGVAMADVALLDRAIAGGGAIRAADLKKVRLGVVAPLKANLDADTQAAYDAALAKMKAAGVTVLDVDMPMFMETNAAVGFPLALYEAYEDMVKYLKASGSGKTIADLAKDISSPDVKGTYDGLVIPRKLPGPNNTVVDAQPAYEAAMKTSRPALQKLYRETFAKHKLDALVFPTVPKVAIDANPESSSIGNFVTYIQNTDPGSNAGIPGLQLPMALGATSKLPVGLELDGPAGSDRKLIAIGLALEEVLGRLPAPKR